MANPTTLSCFKAYDIRGELGVNLDAAVAYRVGRATAQQLCAKTIAVGWDARETSPELAREVARGAMDAGCDVMEIGLAGTEEMYWAVTEFNACGGIEVTASHNPINYNGMKIVKSGSRPLDDVDDFQKIKALAESQDWCEPTTRGMARTIAEEARAAYVAKVVSFCDIKKLKPLKLVVNAGNGAAGPTFDAIAEQLLDQGVPLEFIRVHHQPDHTFPNGIPNPLLPENHAATADVVLREGADFGIAFDGDFDRCFFFDGTGAFVPGEYVVGLLASIFLEKEQGAAIVHDPRAIWNTRDTVARRGGVPIQSKTGHAFIKQSMRERGAIYGGEMSAHHYFRDFAYCDSGMIPWLLVAELVSASNRSLADLVAGSFAAFPSSGEVNFSVNNADQAIERALSVYAAEAKAVDRTDGVSLEFDAWRFNLRKSNTEPLVRLNLEARGDAAILSEKLSELTALLGQAA